MTIRRKDFNAMLARRAAGVVPSKPKKMPRPKHFHALCADADTGTVTLPLHTVTESNTGGHWGPKAARARNQQYVTALGLDLMRLRRPDMALPPFPVRVRFVRLAPRPLDVGDNLNSSFKHIRDAIATRYDVDDGDARWRWKYDQEPSKAYGVRVTIESVGNTTE